MALSPDETMYLEVIFKRYHDQSYEQIIRNPEQICFDIGWLTGLIYLLNEVPKLSRPE